MKINEKIKYVRNYYKFTQSGFGFAFGLSRQSIEDYENGIRKFERGKKGKRLKAFVEAEYKRIRPWYKRFIDYLKDKG